MKIMLYLIGHMKVILNKVNIGIISLFFIMWVLKRYQVIFDFRLMYLSKRYVKETNIDILAKVHNNWLQD